MRKKRTKEMDIKTKVIDAIYKILQARDISKDMITMEKDLVSDLDADSLDIFEIIVNLEKVFNVAINADNAIERVKTVQDVCVFMEEELKEA